MPSTKETPEPVPCQVIRSPRFSARWALELLWGLCAHRINLRYKETMFGFGWIFLQPVALTVIFTYIFHKFAKVPSGEIPYPVFSATGLVLWSFTTLAITQSGNSLILHSGLLRRVRFPKLLLPLSTILAAIVDLVVMCLLLVGLYVYFGIRVPINVPWLLALFAVHFAFLFGLGCLLSLVTVFVRDVTHAIPSLLQLWFFASPVFYPVSMVPEEFRLIARLNPMAGLIEGYRSVLLLGEPPPGDLFSAAAVVAVALLVGGLLAFWRLENFVSDIL